MTEDRVSLPRNIFRPIWTAAICIIVVIGLFVGWSMLAPLSTTVSLNGELASSEPNVTVQHPYGGPVAHILVEQHEHVRQGQLLMRLDVTVETQKLALQIATRDRLQSETNVIKSLLENRQITRDMFNSSSGAPHVLRHQQLHVQEAMAQASANNLQEQIQALHGKVAHAKSQLALMSERAQRNGQLLDQGLLRRSEDEHLREQILIVRGEIDADRASILALLQQINVAQQQIEVTKISLQHELSVKWSENLSRLDQLNGTIADLEHRIESANIYAPLDGIVTNVSLDDENMYAARGTTLIELAKPLEKPQIKFRVPTSYIDQVLPGMKARLVIPSLPQRKMPKVDVELTAISPTATLDENGAPVAYHGLAHASETDLQALVEGLEFGKLSEDMPVVLKVSVRETTFADYLVSPLIDAFQTALQD